MTKVCEAVCKGLRCLLGKQIQFYYGETTINGCLLSFRDREYFFELILKNGRYKKKHIILYPVEVTYTDTSLTLDYRISSIQDEKAQELLYNLIDEDICHPHCNKVIQICK